jgi:hypothetical protein
MSSSTSAVVAAGHHVGGQWQGECNGHDTTSTLGQKFLELRVASKTLRARETALDIVLKMVQKISIQLLVE